MNPFVRSALILGQWNIFHGPVILPYILKTIWWMKVILEIMNKCDKHWPHQIYLGHWPLFHSLVILQNMLKTVWWRDNKISLTQRLTS